MNSLPKTVTRQRRNCDFNPDPSAPESSTLTTRLSSHHASENITLVCFVEVLALVFDMLSMEIDPKLAVILFFLIKNIFYRISMLIHRKN